MQLKIPADGANVPVPAPIMFTVLVLSDRLRRFAATVLFRFNAVGRIAS